MSAWLLNTSTLCQRSCCLQGHRVSVVLYCTMQTHGKLFYIGKTNDKSNKNLILYIENWVSSVQADTMILASVVVDCADTS